MALQQDSFPEDAAGPDGSTPGLRHLWDGLSRQAMAVRAAGDDEVSGPSFLRGQERERRLGYRTDPSWFLG